MAESAGMDELLKMYTSLTLEEIKETTEFPNGLGILPKRNETQRKKQDKAVSEWNISTYPNQTYEKHQSINIILLGKTGAGKSSTGNLITGKDSFKGSAATTSCTRTVEKDEFTVGNVHVTIIDTPGFEDTELPPEEIFTEISKVMDICSDGIDVMLFVCSLGNPRFTKDQKESFDMIKEGLFGKGAINNCFAILTNIDSKKNIKSLLGYIQDQENSDFHRLLTDQLQYRVVAVNNADETSYGRDIQRHNILKLILARKPMKFTSADFQKYKSAKEKLPQNFPWQVGTLAPDIEKAVTDELWGCGYRKIKALSDEGSPEHTEIAGRILDQMMQCREVQTEARGYIQTAIKVTLSDVSDRYIGGSFWGAIVSQVIIIAATVGIKTKKWAGQEGAMGHILRIGEKILKRLK